MTKEKNKLLCRWFHGWTLVKNERAFVSNYFNPHFCPYYYYYYYLFFYFLTWVKNTWDHLVSSPFSVAYQTMENTSFVSTFFFPLFPSATFQFSLQPTNCLNFFLLIFKWCSTMYTIIFDIKKKKKFNMKWNLFINNAHSFTWNEESILVQFNSLQSILIQINLFQSIMSNLVHFVFG